MSIQDEARAEAERRWPSYSTVGFSGAEDRQAAFAAGAEWQASRIPEAAPSDTDGVFAILDELNASNGIGYDDYSRLHDAVSRTSQPVQVKRDELADAMIASDALSDDVRAEARVAGSSQREPFLMFADAVMPFVAQPVQVEVTDDMIERAAKAWHEYKHRGQSWDDIQPQRQAHWRRVAHSALVAALGGGDHAAE